MTSPCRVALTSHFSFLNALCTISSFFQCSFIDCTNLARDQSLVLFTYQLVYTNIKMLVGNFTAINWAHWTFISIFIPHFQQFFFPNSSFKWTLRRSEGFPVGFLCESLSDLVRSAWKIERKAFHEYFRNLKLIAMWSAVLNMEASSCTALPPPSTVSIDLNRGSVNQ